MQFSASPKGHHILAYNSARIYVIDVRSVSMKVERELKILRRPISACVKDDGSLLAILSTEMQVDIYDLQQSPPRRTQSLILDNTPRAIALSPCGSVLAAAYEGGIEVTSLASNALPTDRRAVKCDAVDALAFSFDGTQILGTTIQSQPPSTVILTAPYYDPGSHLPDDNISPLWTTSILFPNSSRDCSHAVLLQDGHQEEASWTFTYDQSFETFRAVRIDDLRNGTTHFTGPVPSAHSQAKLLPCTLPAASYHGELVSAGFHGKEVWVYGVPNDLDTAPDTGSSSNDEGSVSSGLGRENSGRSGSSRRPSTRAQDANGGRLPQWQLLYDKRRNKLVAGSKVSELTGVSNVKWVAGFGQSSAQERLVVTARGVSGPRLVTEEEDIDFVDGGRITLLDFDYTLGDGEKAEITLEVGTDEAEVLEEEQRDLETEVAIVRRRTVAQRRGGRTNMLRAATSASRPPPPPVPSLPSQTRDAVEDDDPLLPRRIGQSSVNRSANPEPLDPEEEEEGPTMEEMEALDAPYAHASPRSHMTLRRAATAAAVNRTLHPRTADGRPIVYRRADGRGEHPHESDADNWVPPPPPYQKDDPGDLPAFLRGPAVAPPIAVTPPVPSIPGHHSSGQDQPPSNETKGGRLVSGSSTQTSNLTRTSVEDFATRRPLTSESSELESRLRGQRDAQDDIYDVTPPSSPGRPRRHSAATAQSETEIQLSPGIPPLSSRVSRPLTAPIDLSAFGAPPRQVSEGESSQATTSELSGRRNQPNTTTPSRARGLSNVQTWPGGPGSETNQPQNTSEFPFPAPTSRTEAEEASSALPPLPSSSQLASLSKRVSQGNPRRFSGGYQMGQQGTSSRQQMYSLTEPEFDQPLIISTPKGVSGAYDAPSRHQSGRRNETPLLAPIPRHPRPTPTSITRPTVERLETIYSVASSHGGQPAPVVPPAAQALPSMVPAWLNAPTVPPSRTSPSVNRRPSRAGRSAAKNIHDAKKRGWKAKNKKHKKSTDAASSAGWTDVSFGSATNKEGKTEKDKKCIMM